MPEERQAAIIRNAGYGNRDVGSPVLSFEVYVAESSAALQIFSQPKADEIIKASGVDDVRDLNGKPCWVRVGANTIRFEEMWRV